MACAGLADAALRRADALGDARAAEDRPHRVSVAHPPFHRSVGGILLRAEDRRAGIAGANGATAYDIPDVACGHVGPECSFDAFIRLHQLRHPALDALATIVRGADTSSLHLAPPSAGLLAVSRGLASLFADDHEMLKWRMLVCDALYQSCRETQDAPAAGMPGEPRTRAVA
jgi:hypothetical protein